MVKKRVTDKYIEMWLEDVNTNSKCYNYRMFKTDLIFEKYLILLPSQLRVKFTHFRVSNHMLPIERGRHYNIPRGERLCEICNRLGDEYHYLFECVKFKTERKTYLSKSFQSHVSAQKYHQLLSTTNYKKICKIAKFAAKIMLEFK